MSSSTKTELLHEASRMLLAKGLNGFSLQELATSLNIKKASLFHHFPSKKALAIELYQFYQSSFQTWISEHEALKPEKQILAYAQELVRWIVIKKRVCPVGALSLEWHLVEPDLQTEIKKLHLLQKNWLTQMFKEISKTKKLNLSIHDAVLSSMALLQGSIQIARINNAPELVMKNLKSHLKIIMENS
jgi:TetR/AcrR family transcriptional repressor of nem operon